MAKGKSKARKHAARESFVYLHAAANEPDPGRAERLLGAGLTRLAEAWRSPSGSGA